MPYRKTPLITNQIYHVFNRSVARQPIFLRKNYYQRALDTIDFYSYYKPSLRFSHYIRLPLKSRAEYITCLRKNYSKQVEIYAFCIMPNHVHLLLKQLKENGISMFMRNFQNSYAKFLNTREERTGPLFQPMFKAALIQTDEQLLHVTRYIHINPVTSYILKEIAELENYQYSSYGIYLNNHKLDLLNKNFVLSYFSSVAHFKTFHIDQIDYQKKLSTIKHLILE